MPTKNSRVPIPVPSAGVRRDMDPLQMDPSALEIGQNVIVRKGVLVPRACHESLEWYSNSEWKSVHIVEDSSCVGYDPANTTYILCRTTGMANGDGQLVISTDEFATSGNYGISDPDYDYFTRMIHDAVNNVWIGLTNSGYIFTAPDNFGAGAPTWTKSLDVGPGVHIPGGLVHDPVSGYSMAIIAPDPSKLYSVYLSSDGETWAMDGTLTLGDWGVGECELGVGAETGGAEYFYLRTPHISDPEKNDIKSVLCSAPGGSGWDNTYDTGIDRSHFFGGGTLTCCIKDDGSENLVQKSDDLGATWTTELGTGLAYTGERYCKLYYDATLKWLVLGGDNYRSADAATWDQYPNLPFDPSQILDAVADGTDWFILSDEGLWKFPSTNFDDEEVIVSMFQFDSETVENQVIVSSAKTIRKLNSATGEFTALGLPGADPPSFDISSNPRGQRTVFRTYPWTGPSGSDYYNYLLATNPQLPLCYWDSAVDELTTCDLDNAPGAKVLLIAANRVIIANIPSWSPHGIAVSGDLDPTDWGGLNALNSGLLADTPGEITAGAELSALQFAIFKEDCVYHGIAQTEFAGVANAFRYELVRPGIQGPVSQHALCRTPFGSLIYLGQDGGIYQYDGNTPQDIGGHARRIVETQMDFQYKDHSWGYVDNMERLAYFFFPTNAGNMNRGISIDLQSGAVWEIQLPEWFQAAAGGPLFITQDLTWSDFDLAWREMTASWNSFQKTDFHMILASENNTWGRQRWGNVESYTDFGEPISVRWHNGWSPLGDPDSYSTLLEIRHNMALMSSGEEFNVTAYAVDSEFDSEKYTDVDVLTSETDYRTSEFDADGMLFRYEINAKILKKFVWGGGLARFVQRGTG